MRICWIATCTHDIYSAAMLKGSCGLSHLQEDTESIPDAVSLEGVEGLGAVAALQHERLAGGALREPRLQVARLAGKHQRRHACDVRDRPL